MTHQDFDRKGDGNISFEEFRIFTIAEYDKINLDYGVNKRFWRSLMKFFHQDEFMMKHGFFESVLVQSDRLINVRDTAFLMDVNEATIRLWTKNNMFPPADENKMRKIQDVLKVIRGENWRD